MFSGRDCSARRAWGQNGMPATIVPPAAMRPTAASTLSRPSLRPVDVLEVKQQSKLVNDHLIRRPEGDGGRGVAPLALCSTQPHRCHARQQRDTNVVMMKVTAAQTHTSTRRPVSGSDPVSERARPANVTVNATQARTVGLFAGFEPRMPFVAHSRPPLLF